MSDFEVNRLNKFGIGIVVICIAALGIIWYTNPELITFWLKKETLQGKIVWQGGNQPTVILFNNTPTEWKNVKVTLNKNSVSQRYEFSVPSIKMHPKGFHIPAAKFQKSNGEVYDINAGQPHMITVQATIEKKNDDGSSREVEGLLEIKGDEKKI